MRTVTRTSATPVLLGLALWLVVALVAGASGAVRALRPPAPQLVLAALTVLALVALARVPSLRRWAEAVDPRWLVAAHLTRFVGVYFLLLFQRAELPFAFAVPGGWGDILMASLALVLLLSGPPNTRARRIAYLTWNVVALVELLFVVLTAARLGLADPSSIAALLRLPLSLLPTFLVPILLATHVLLFVRLLRRPAEPRPPQTATPSARS